MNAELMRSAGAKIANTMFNLAQRAGSTIDSDLAAEFDKMRKEWDVAVRAPSSATTAGERQSIDDGEFQRLEVAYVRALHACEDDLTAENANAASNARAALIAHIDTWAARIYQRGRMAAIADYQDIVDAARSAGDAVPEKIASWLRRNANAEQEPAKRDVFIEAHNAARQIIQESGDT
jgi:hypothetical protein